MELKSFAALSALSLGLLSPSAHAALGPVATADVDWSSFAYQLFDTNPSDGIVPSLVFHNQSSNVYASTTSGASNDTPDWISSINAVDGIANSGADAAGLSARFLSQPSTLNAYASASRYGNFTLTANTVVSFSIGASAYIDTTVPLNGQAYSWATLNADGPSPDGLSLGTQHGSGSRLVFAQASGLPQSDYGTIYAVFLNATGGDMEGTLTASAQVSSSGFIAVVPEPESYAMMLAGLALMGFAARRRLR